LDQLRQLGDLCMPRMRSSGPEDKRLGVDEDKPTRCRRQRACQRIETVRRAPTHGGKEGWIARGRKRKDTH
jgi:hypothetical protein